MADASSSKYSKPQVAMTVASLAYASCGDVSGYLSNTAYATNGEWSLEWGPAQSETRGNQMFIARSSQSNQFAIAIRGTVVDVSLALLVDLYQDLDVGHPVPLPFPSAAGAVIGKGTLGGLTDLIGMSSGGMTLLDYAKANFVGSGAEVLVTGHSLGGALTTVLAPWLLFQLQQLGDKSCTVTPLTFAAPTAGNDAFATWYDSLFTQSARYYNTVDVIPKAWASLLEIVSLYPAPGPKIPWELKGAVEMVSGWMSQVQGVIYAQTNGSGSPLPNTPAAGDDFLQELGDQHGHNTYLKLLGAPLLPF